MDLPDYFPAYDRYCPDRGIYRVQRYNISQRRTGITGTGKRGRSFQECEHRLLGYHERSGHECPRRHPRDNLFSTFKPEGLTGGFL